MLEVVLAIVIAAALAAALAWPLKWRHRRVKGAGAAWLFALVVLFPILWLSSVYFPPLGPPIAGVSWVVMLLAGLLVLLVIAAVAPPIAEKAASYPEVDTDSVSTAMIFLDVMLWVFLIGSAALLVIGLAAY